MENKKQHTTGEDWMKSDEDLIRACIKENREAQGLLYKKYANKMFAVCMRYCNSREEAEDVLQDGFIKVFDKISKYRGDGSFEGWIRTIMVNTSLRSWDKRAMKFEPGNIDDIAEPAVDEKVLSNIGAKDIMDMLARLPEGYKVVFNLFAIEGYSHKEIGEILNVNESTSRSQYARARQSLIKMLEKVESKAKAS
ncbi:MAG: sigma-70 family RNA polymerase sigma factor [Bacteroidia bacterium]